MSHLVTSQRDLNGRITRAFDNLKKQGMNNITKSNVISRLETLRRNWAKYELQHDQLLALAASDLAFAGNTYFQDKALAPAAMEEVFTMQEALFMDKLEEMTKVERAAALAVERLSGEKSGPAAGVETARSKASLPRLPLPTFDGKHKDWPLFQGLFRSLVTLDKSLTDAERLHYLLGALTGDAALLLRNMPEREENFEAAWELLQERYDNQRLAVKAIMANLFGLPTLTQASGTELKQIFYTVWDSVKALATLKRPFDSTGDWLVHLVADRMDPQSRKEWETRISRTKTLPTFTELQEFLEGRVNTVEALEESRKGPDRPPRQARPA